MIKRLRSTASAAAAFSLTCGLIAAVANPASARTLPAAPSADLAKVATTVSVADLDLSQTPHQRKLSLRIRAAARQVCNDGVTRLISMSDQACRRGAVSSTDSQVARLIDRATQLAAAGQSTQIDAEVAMTAAVAE